MLNVCTPRFEFCLNCELSTVNCQHSSTHFFLDCQRDLPGQPLDGLMVVSFHHHPSHRLRARQAHEDPSGPPQARLCRSDDLLHLHEFLHGGPTTHLNIDQDLWV